MVHAPSFLGYNQHLVRIDSTSEPPNPPKALLLGWQRDKMAVTLMIGVVALLSIVAGVVVGLLTRNASLGIAASSGLTALLAFVQVIVIWQSR